MFGFITRRRPEPGYVAAQHTNTPLSQDLVLMFAEELPMLDSAARARVYRLLESYEGPTITRQEDLPEEIRQIMDLD